MMRSGGKLISPNRIRIRAIQQLEAADRFDLAGLDPHHRGGDAADIRRLMADVDHRHALDALALAARKLAGAPLEQVADIEHPNDAAHLGSVAPEPAHAPAVVEIALHGEMRE